MRELIVETSGDFMLLDVLGGQEIAASGETLVKETRFVQTALEDGRLVETEAKAKVEPKPKPDAAAPTSGKQAAAPKKDS